MTCWGTVRRRPAPSRAGPRRPAPASWMRLRCGTCRGWRIPCRRRDQGARGSTGSARRRRSRFPSPHIRGRGCRMRTCEPFCRWPRPRGAGRKRMTACRVPLCPRRPAPGRSATGQSLRRRRRARPQSVPRPRPARSRTTRIRPRRDRHRRPRDPRDRRCRSRDRRGKRSTCPTECRRLCCQCPHTEARRCRARSWRGTAARPWRSRARWCHRHARRATSRPAGSA